LGFFVIVVLCPSPNFLLKKVHKLLTFFFLEVIDTMWNVWSFLILVHSPVPLLCCKVTSTQTNVLNISGGVLSLISDPSHHYYNRYNTAVAFWIFLYPWVRAFNPKSQPTPWGWKNFLINVVEYLRAHIKLSQMWEVLQVCRTLPTQNLRLRPRRLYSSFEGRLSAMH